MPERYCVPTSAPWRFSVVGSWIVKKAVSSDPNASFRHGVYGDVEPSKDVTPHSWRLRCLDKKTR
jgi:hypothetical protein